MEESIYYNSIPRCLRRGGSLLNSPGGIGLAAERIIRICRAYSKTGTYDVIVPNKAKSAATMICLGARKIYMGKVSELCAVDPQVVFGNDDKAERFSVYNLIQSYNELFEKAVKEKGNLEPYLQQLAKYDARHIQEMKKELELSADIAVKTLKTGMLSSFSEKRIRTAIKTFLVPEKVKTHGRPIYSDDARKCGLTIEEMALEDPKWELIYETFVRIDEFVSHNSIAKCIETKEHSFVVSSSEK